MQSHGDGPANFGLRIEYLNLLAALNNLCPRLDFLLRRGSEKRFKFMPGWGKNGLESLQTKL